MIQNNESDFIVGFKNWINSVILSEIKEENTFGAKLDTMERVIELARFYAEKETNDIPYDDFVKNKSTFFDNLKIYIRKSDNSQKIKSYKKPDELETPLLAFLLVHNVQNEDIYIIIKKFINEIRADLSPLDFEKGRAGAIRCFTNTRFAAKLLRDIGLLKFTQKEAFKTWELSFLGILVSAFIYSRNWREVTKQIRYNSFILFPDRDMIHKLIYPRHKANYWIYRTIYEFSDEKKFTQRLNWACQNCFNIKFELFKNSIAKIYSLIKKYSELSKFEERQNKRSELLNNISNELEKIPEIEKFMSVFKNKYEMEDFTKRIKPLFEGIDK
ncbi:MAG: hypothetical protein ABIA97_06885 [Candidatus Omnitrophota bacterium]